MEGMGKTLPKKALRKAARRHNWALQWCWNYERMQAFGFAYAMAPILRERCADRGEVCDRLGRYLDFYNTQPGASAAIFGACVRLEAEGQPELALSLRSALMGPMAGIGDTVQAALVQPAAYLLGIALALWGCELALPAAAIPLLILFVLRWPLFDRGYRRGTEILSDLGALGDLQRLRRAVLCLLLSLAGGLLPCIRIPVSLGPTVFRKVLSLLLPAILTGLCCWLLRAKKLSPGRVILLTAVITFGLGALGILR